MSSGVTRRRFLTASAAVLAGSSSVLLGRAPAFAQKRELTLLTFNHFVPASDDELKKQAEAFSKQAGVTVRVDTIAGPQLFAKRAAQASSQSGHDLVVTGAADPFLYEQHLVDMGDLVDFLGNRYGGWYPFARETCQTASGWKAVPWYWVAFPGSYNEAHFKKAGLTPPKTWDDLLKAGKILKKQGNPVGIPISHCTDANISFWSVLWSSGGKVLEPDGKTPAINSDAAARVVEWYKELYKDAMEPEVLSWDNASNNRFLLSGKGSWIHNPVSPYVAAVAKQMPIADDINHHNSPGGPAGIHSATGVNSLAIWKFSKNVPLAKDFIKFLFQKENYDAFIVAGQRVQPAAGEAVRRASHLGEQSQVRDAPQGGGIRARAGLAGQAKRERSAHRGELHPARHRRQGHQWHAHQACARLGRGPGQAGGGREAEDGG